MNPFRLKACLAFCLGAAWSALAANGIHSARMRAEPASPYVGEDFSLVLEVVADPGSEIELAGISGVPNSLPLSVEPFAAAGVRADAAADGAPVQIHSFRAAARGARAFSFEPRTMVSLRKTERKNAGFFTSLSTRTVTAPLSWPSFRIRELPTEGRPADFSGAVGRFRMRLEATPVEVMPRDIVELRLTLSGTGFLGEARPAMPVLDPALFKTYPPTVKSDEGAARLTITQSVIPLSTNAVEIGSARFSFFDAAAGVYTNALTAPVHLAFRERRKSDEPAVREVKVDAPSRAVADEGIDVSRYLALPRGKTSLQVARATALRIAPGPQAKVILSVPAGSGAVPLEAERGWLRVKVLDRTGWIPARDTDAGGDASSKSSKVPKK